MHISTLAAASLLTLAALTPGDANAQGAPYRAAGTEPFWGLTITAQTIKFESPNLRAPVTVATPRVIHGFAGEIYRTRRINVNIIHKSCSDGMSDRTYPDTVQVSVDGRQYQGCGGAAAVAEAPRPAIEGNWRVESIEGRPVVRGTTVTVRFENGRVSGNTGCNSFSGRFSFDRGRLKVGPLISTRRACTRYTGGQESHFLALLGERLSVSQNRGGKLVLTGARGRTLVLVREAGRR